MASYNKNLLKQLPFYEEKIKPKIKEFTNARLLWELQIFKKPIKAKIKQLTNEKLLGEQPFYNQPIKKPRRKKSTNQQLLRVLPFCEVEAVDKKGWSDPLVLSKHSIKNLFNDLLREKKGFKYILTIKITLKKPINYNENIFRTIHFSSEAKTITNQRY